MPLYEDAVRPLLFRLDPERAHELTLRASELSGRSTITRRVARRALGVRDPLGFGHVEIGSVSAYPSDGNPRPRLFRIPQDRGIVVSYGVPNEGADAVKRRLDGHRPTVAVGVNLVKTNDPARP